MHILLIHQAFAALDEPGGTRHHEFARLLVERGHRVTVIASQVSYLTGAAGARREAQEGGGLTILRARVYAAHHKSFVHRVFAFLSFMTSSFFLGLRVRKVDLVWGTSPPIFQGLTAWLLARLKGVPFLFEVRDLWPEFAIAVGVLRNRLLIRLSLGLERFLYRRADRVMVNSPGYVEHVRARGAREVELVPNGADPGMFDPSDEGTAFRQRCASTGSAQPGTAFRQRGASTGSAQPEKSFIVLYAGAHGLSNDLGTALEAARLLQTQVPGSSKGAASSVRLVLLGDGKEKPALERRAAELGLGNVLFLPPLPKNGMAAALAGADACLAILKPIEAYKKPYPNKVFDYMAAGRPLVLAIDGAIRQVVEAAGCGIFAQPGDPSALAAAIRKLAADHEASRRMGLAGRQYLEQHFNREKIGESLVRLLEQMAA